MKVNFNPDVNSILPKTTVKNPASVADNKVNFGKAVAKLTQQADDIGCIDTAKVLKELFLDEIILDTWNACVKIKVKSKVKAGIICIGVLSKEIVRMH